MTFSEGRCLGSRYDELSPSSRICAPYDRVALEVAGVHDRVPLKAAGAHDRVPLEAAGVHMCPGKEPGWAHM
jgi:hypothetical protein